MVELLLAVCVVVLAGQPYGGLVNGMLVGTFRVAPAIVTLAMVTFLRDAGSIAGLSPDGTWLGRYD